MLSQADVSSTIRAAVTATNSAGSSTAISQQTPAVQGNGSSLGLVQKASIQGSGVSSVSVAFPARNNAGNLIIAFVRASTTSQSVTVNDSLGNKYVRAVNQGQDSDGHQTNIFYAANCAAGANTVARPHRERESSS